GSEGPYRPRYPRRPPHVRLRLPPSRGNGRPVGLLAGSGRSTARAAGVDHGTVAREGVEGGETRRLTVDLTPTSTTPFKAPIFDQLRPGKPPRRLREGTSAESSVTRASTSHRIRIRRSAECQL